MSHTLLERQLKQLAVEAGLLESPGRIGLAPVRPVAEVLEALAEAGLTDEQIAWLVACDLQLSFVPLEQLKPDSDAEGWMPLDQQLRYKAVPLRVETIGGGELLYVAMLPERAKAVAVFLTNLLGITVVPVATSAVSLRDYFDVRFGRKAARQPLVPVSEFDLDTPVGLIDARGVYRKGSTH